jgi:hypothetical protein
MSFPMGGMDVQNNDLSEVKAGDGIRQQPEVFLGIGAAITTYPAGLVLGRVTASGVLTPYVVGASDGSEVIAAVLPFDATTDATPTAMQIEAIVKGEVSLVKLVTNVPAALSLVEQDACRDIGIFPIDSTDTSILDNQ